ncbi:predicted protein [Aspergillus terreus NIH2624]|uniref:Uncharacterized protein n=1 Tax=Aspergillus terreus (strain NIH 2624 / FGSC A1156) TaxID=341663 RepID=Q0D1Q4_ASPTN|nr:uncharacterized protein ATEG_00130 [Aspergillus terreus NIH2624]EAU38776.1 predicted protein [Aspergillus terreus NIH2624]
MSGLQVPPVTLEDLQAFHAKHFPWTQPASSLAHPNDATLVEEYVEGDDDLGFYPDGVKRTLTDEQIEIFRHSEIHALLREKQLKEEALAEKMQECDAEKDAGPIPGNSTHGPAEQAAAQMERSSEHATPKMQSENDSAALNYEESDTRTSRARPERPPHFAGRRIISYED